MTRRQREDPSLSRLPSAIKRIGTLAAGGAGGVAIPGITVLTEHSPPLFPLAALLTGSAGVFILVWGYRSKFDIQVIPKRAVIIIMLAIASVVGYEVGLRFLTVLPPVERGRDREQIGFHMAAWSLTDYATEQLTTLNADPEIEVTTPLDAMMALGGYKDGPEIIWKPWTIILAGLVLLVLFAAGFALWTYGFAITARLFASESELP